MTKARLTVRYTSGREDHFEVELYGGAQADFRLQEFVKDPTLVLETENELIVIPAQAVERITIGLPQSGRDKVSLPSVRKAKRLS